MHHRLLWITDLHLEFQRAGSYAWLAKAIKSSGASALLLTGDIMPSLRLPSALIKLVESVGVPVYFVLGNHDYYGWSIAETETAVDQALYAAKKSKRALIWLDRQDGPIPLDRRTTLVGTGGWGDFSGFEGCGYAELNDEWEIKEFLSLRGPALAQYHQQLAHQSAEKFRPKLEAALETSSQVIIGTHVSPFRGSTWHEGNISEPAFLNRFCNATLGRVIEGCSQAVPGTKIFVICGHTHSGGYYKHKVQPD
jgi:Icc protein